MKLGKYLITFCVFDARSKTEFTNNSLKTPKLGKLNIDTLITPQGLLIHGKNYFCEYLRENETIFENILACEYRDPVLLIHEKNRGQKSHDSVPLRIKNVKKILQGQLKSYLCIRPI